MNTITNTPNTPVNGGNSTIHFNSVAELYTAQEWDVNAKKAVGSVENDFADRLGMQSHFWEPGFTDDGALYNTVKPSSELVFASRDAAGTQPIYTQTVEHLVQTYGKPETEKFYRSEALGGLADFLGAPVAQVRDTDTIEYYREADLHCEDGEFIKSQATFTVDHGGETLYAIIRD